MIFIAIIALALASVLDITTSFVGLLGVFGIEHLSGDFSTIVLASVAFIVSLLILSLSVFSPAFWPEDDAFSYFMKFIHLFAFSYDAFSSFFGTTEFILFRTAASTSNSLNMSLIFEYVTVEQVIAIGFSTIVLVLSPIMLGVVYSKQ